jgi:thiol-disulfide isomerase/thioredoxin
LIIILLCACCVIGANWWDDSKAFKITTSNIKDLLGPGDPDMPPPSTHYVVEFFGEHCVYCQKFLPDWNRLAQEYNDKSNIKISTINADKERSAIAKFGINAYPTLVYFPPGKSMYKYTFSEHRNYQNVKDWILK